MLAKTLSHGADAGTNVATETKTPTKQDGQTYFGQIAGGAKFLPASREQGTVQDHNVAQSFGLITVFDNILCAIHV